jgi:hypothetical protein
MFSPRGLGKYKENCDNDAEMATRESTLYCCIIVSKKHSANETVKWVIKAS